MDILPEVMSGPNSFSAVCVKSEMAIIAQMAPLHPFENQVVTDVHATVQIAA